MASGVQNKMFAHRQCPYHQGACTIQHSAVLNHVRTLMMETESPKRRLVFAWTIWRGWQPEMPFSQSQWPRCLSCGYTASHFLGLRVRIPQEVWMSCLLWVLYVVRSLRRADRSSRGFLPSVCVSECEFETSIMRRPCPTRGFCAI